MSNVRIAGMNTILTQLSNMHREVESMKIKHQLGNSFLGAVNPIVGFINLIRGENEKNQTLDDSIRLTGMAIDILAGNINSEKYGNLYIRASEDDEVYSFWLSYAQNTGETMAMALGYTSWSVLDFVKDGWTNLGTTVKPLVESGESAFYWLFAFAVVVLLIIVFK